ncbi:MAG: DNA polymerase III subunit delta [Marinobacter sp.]|uniref:DNA polymerase III subunit delta n=1 Tax=Marinobacter sp. TaxID=50741 RepID=UPI0034A0774B
MKATPAQLNQLLSKKLAPVYLVSGDEPLLVQEACDEIRKTARTAGYEDRVTFHADKQLDWRSVAEECGALSLFAEKRRIEIHLPTGKLGDGRDVIEQFLASPADDIVLLLISVKLDPAELRRKWYKTLQNEGVHVTVWPIDPDKFPGWLQQRAKAQGLTLTRGALDMLVHRLEGNLLAASQEMDRLALFSKTKTIDEEVVEQAVQNSARFNLFELVTELLMGDVANAQKIIGALEQEGDNPLGLLAVLSRDIHLVIELQQALANRETPGGFLKSRGIRQPQRMKAMERAARRLSPEQLRSAVLFCSDIDRASKGFSDLGPWHYLRSMATALV